MGASPAGLPGKLAGLLALFHRGSLDVPDGLIARECIFRFNGIAYEDTLGRHVSDPLVRLLGRGPAAYRFLAQRVRYVVPDARIELDELTGPDRRGLVTGVALLRGTPRGAAEVLTCRVGVALVIDGAGRLTEVGVQIPDEAARAFDAAGNA